MESEETQLSPPPPPEDPRRKSPQERPADARRDWLPLRNASANTPPERSRVLPPAGKGNVGSPLSLGGATFEPFSGLETRQQMGWWSSHPRSPANERDPHDANATPGPTMTGNAIEQKGPKMTERAETINETPSPKTAENVIGK